MRLHRTRNLFVQLPHQLGIRHHRIHHQIEIDATALGGAATTYDNELLVLALICTLCHRSPRVTQIDDVRRCRAVIERHVAIRKSATLLDAQPYENIVPRKIVLAD